MISVNAGLKRLNPGSWWPRYNKLRQRFDAALLSRNEILKLRARVEQQNGTIDYRHEVEHRTLGDARSVYRGYGMDYDESRPYFPGDELRFMNWRITARTGEPHMKVFREERKPGVFIVVDRRQDMRFGTRCRLKVTQAVRAAAVMAFDAHLQNTPVAGVLLESDEKPKLSWITESFDEAGVFNFIHAANKPCPPPASAQASHLSGNRNEESLSHVIKLMIPMLAQGSNVILISDFYDLDDSCRSSLLELSMMHRLQAIHIIDPVEVELPECGNLLTQSQHQSVIGINSSNKQSSSQYHRLASSFLESKQQLFRSLAIPCQSIMTNDNRIEQIIEI
ncbi:hypothetical protein BMS3Bbin11_00340 [bacterium BMS3Bbin11]|nr:hypothetical protein BMS3Abin11_01416 [bacterium BMS3Abin11]GBE45259.1 hypothetical protein BMS3Bbin11_00340 [bacterium BMS3Bbin11]